MSVPEIDPGAASAEALRLYDKDSNGSLSKSEAESVPGILLHWSLYDANGDDSASREEIESRLGTFLSKKVGQTILAIRVVWNGRPLSGAEVKLVPEPYLGDQVKTAWGTTDAGGMAAMDIRDEDLPASDAGIVGVHLGTYKVEVTHPEIAIPEKYNSKTTLGYESERGNPGFVVNLKK